MRRRAADFDVLDVSTGDNWVWAGRGRPGGGDSAALLTRSHGLEHTVDLWQRADAAAGNSKLSWKYPLYHGGFRLWEERRSLHCADHCLLLNEIDRDFAVQKLGVLPSRISLVANGIGTQFLGLPVPTDDAAVPLKLAAVGTWIDRKGKRILADVAEKLVAKKIGFVLTLLGTGFDEVQVRSDFLPEVRPFVRVVPQYKNTDLPVMLQGQHVLLMCSFTEGYALALPEGMACGLAPIATRVGGASLVVVPGHNGELVDPGQSDPIIEILSRWNADRPMLLDIRRKARQSVQQHGWSQIAAQTINIYEAVLRRVRRPHGPVLAGTDSLSPPNTIWQRDGKPTLSICVCTANRPAVLRRCLASIDQGDQLPDEVIVGDDSIDGTETAAVCREFPFVRYVHGPRQGLCANRNVVIAAAAGQYISLLDDDAEVTPNFVRVAVDIASVADGRTLFTGDVMEDGVRRVVPSNPTFWGHFGKPLNAGACEIVQLNSNLFPRSALADARFDERIVYGYEDMDLCQQILAGGHRIEYRPELVNLHLPPPKTRQVKLTQHRMAERARYYTSIKRYLLWQRRPLMAGVFVAIAPLHQALHHLRHLRLAASLSGFADIGWALRRVWTHQHTTILPPRKA